MLQDISKNTQKLESGDAAAIKAVAQYLYHLRIITIVRLLNPVVIASQKYRGATIALLGGSTTYGKKAEELRKEIDRRFVTLKYINHEFSDLVSVNIIEQLEQEWCTVCGWSGNDALEIFKLHSHFIEEQMKIIWSVADRENSFTLSSSDRINVCDSKPDSDGIDERMLIHFVIREIPELIEIIARIRGLASHAAVLGYCDNEHRTWLEYLVNTLNQKKEKFRDISNSLRSSVYSDVPALVDLQIHDVNIVRLVQIVNQHILSVKDIQINSEIIFEMATNIIDAHSVVENQGLSYIRRKVDRLLDDWHIDAAKLS